MSDKCGWMFFDYDKITSEFIYETGCGTHDGEMFYIPYALGTERNKYKYCPACGKPIEEVKDV
jgi:RNA polymerase-binding transcription factor DksA